MRLKARLHLDVCFREITMAGLGRDLPITAETWMTPVSLNRSFQDSVHPGRRPAMLIPPQWAAELAGCQTDPGRC